MRDQLGFLALLLTAAACSDTGSKPGMSVPPSSGASSGGMGQGAGTSAGASSGGASGGQSAAGMSGGGAGWSSGGAVGGGGGGGAVVPELGKTALLIGQSGRRAHVDYVLGTQSVPAGGSVYAELYSGELLSFEQAAFVDYLARYYPGSFVEVGLSWKDNRVNAGYCDLADAACRDAGGAIDPELDIVRGKYDAALDAFGERMKRYAGLTFLVRVDYEVSPGMHCAPNDEDTCPAYADAFRYVRARWQQAGVTNAQLVYHPTRSFTRQMYPGADVTDWIAFSVFNHDLCLPTPEGENGGCAAGAHLDRNLAADLAWAAQQGKPLLIAESTVQKPSDESAQGFNLYLSRLLEIVDLYPQVRGLTYINMKWAGGWIYGEDWTQGAFGNVDARLARFPETRSFFCETLAAGRFRGLAGAPLTCETPNVSVPPLPPLLDAPAYDRMVLLGSNRCARARSAEPAGGDAVVLSDCSQLSASGQGRFRIAEQGGATQIWSDWSWQCWSAEGDLVVQRPCADASSQAFEVQTVGQPGPSRDVRLVAKDGRCVTAGEGASGDAALGLGACSTSDLQVFRL